MKSETPDGGSSPEVAGWAERLATAEPSDRRDLVLQAIEADPEGRLRLEVTGGEPAILDGLDLGPASLGSHPDLEGGPRPWWDARRKAARLAGADLRGARLRRAVLRRADMRGADLGGASLGRADLRGALLEEARLAEADLVGARLSRAAMGKADLRGAMLEEADLRAASLRFAEMSGAVLEQACLMDADLWSARLDSASLVGADMKRVILKEADLRRADLSDVDLRRADLEKADFRDAILRGADLRGAHAGGADFRGAIFQGARLEGVDLSRSNLAKVRFDGAQLARTRIRREQLGDAIGEDLARDFPAAGRSYQALERNFIEIGDFDAARWAYLKRRRMEKFAAFAQARAALQGRRWRAFARSASLFASDQSVEWLCDYGESVPRVMVSLLAVLLGFAFLYGMIGGIEAIAGTGKGQVSSTVRNPVDLITFSLLTMTSAGPPADLMPSGGLAQLMTGLQAAVGITLTGLLGFVLGNRIRR